MKGQFLVGSGGRPSFSNIYADRSAMVIHWLLSNKVNQERFSIREAARAAGVSLGLTQKVIAALVYRGFMGSEGIRTAKQFFLRSPRHLIESWREQYSLVEKCKLKTYATGLSSREEAISLLVDAPLANKVVLALHSAAADLGCRNTNLQTLELYVIDPNIETEVEELLSLEPRDRGYEILLIQPYYKSLLETSVASGRSNVDGKSQLASSDTILTYLDLYNYPLRGREQADFLAERRPEIAQIFNG